MYLKGSMDLGQAVLMPNKKRAFWDYGTVTRKSLSEVIRYKTGPMTLKEEQFCIPTPTREHNKCLEIFGLSRLG